MSKTILQVKKKSKTTFEIVRLYAVVAAQKRYYNLYTWVVFNFIQNLILGTNKKK